MVFKGQTVYSLLQGVASLWDTKVINLGLGRGYRCPKS